MTNGSPFTAVHRSASFGRSVRLIHSRDFQCVFEQGRSIAGRLMVIWIGEGTKDLRLGVVASKRTFRRAVDRNRAKRLLREAFRLERSEFECSADLVIVARRRILDAGVVSVRKEFCQLSSGLGLLSHKSQGEQELQTRG